MTRIVLIAAVLLALTAPLWARGKPLVLASTPDVAAIVRSVSGDLAQLQVIMPAGADAHTFTISSQQVRALQQASLVVFANSHDLGFEETVKAAVPGKPVLDWPDYAAEGASVHDYPNYPQNPHGPWLRLDNAVAMAKAIAPKLKQIGLSAAAVDANLADFEREVAAQQVMWRRLALEHGLAGRPLLAVIPGVCDLIANMDVPVGGVLMMEGSGTVSGQELQDAVSKLKTGQYAALVCPISMKEAKQGEAARQIAADSGAPIAYVRFLDTDLSKDTYLSVSAYNAATLSALDGGATRKAVPAAPAKRQPWLWLGVLAVAMLLIGAIIGNAARRRKPPICGAGIFEPKDQ